LLRSLLEPDFDVVGEAADGYEAVAAVMRDSPDAVVIDYSMPRMTGEEATAAIRELRPLIKILACSALPIDASWADAFISKERINEVPAVLFSLVA
jgi:CheY-like chemotaxis protein